MAGDVLAQLYVDVTQRGVEGVGVQLRGIQRQADDTARAVRRMREEIQNVGQVQARPAVLQRGGGGFGNVEMTRPAQAAGGVIRGPQAVGSGGAGATADAMKGLLGTVGAVTAAVGGLVAAFAPFVALMNQGFQGTVEMEQFGMAVMQVARELAGMFAPVLRVATEFLNTFVGQFRDGGTLIQSFALRSMGAFGLLAEVFTNPQVLSAMRQLLAAFGQLNQALAPIRTILFNISTEFLRLFVIEPLVKFLNGLTLVALMMERVARGAGMVASAVAQAVGAGKLNEAVSGPRREVRLNQTGTEDANGTFQRIQQAVLKAAMPDEESVDPNLEELKRLTAIVDGISKWVQQRFQQAKDDIDRPIAMIQGGAAGAGATPGLAAGVLGGLFGRR